MIFHKEELFNEFMDISKQTEKQYGDDKFHIEESDNEIVINVIDKV